MAIKSKLDNSKIRRISEYGNDKETEVRNQKRGDINSSTLGKTCCGCNKYCSYLKQEEDYCPSCLARKKALEKKR